MVVTRNMWGVGKEETFWADPETTGQYIQGVLGADRAITLGAIALGAVLVRKADEPKAGEEKPEVLD